MISLLLFTPRSLAARHPGLSTGEISGRPRGTRWPSAGPYLAAYGEYSLAADTPTQSRSRRRSSHSRRSQLAVALAIGHLRARPARQLPRPAARRPFSAALRAVAARLAQHHRRPKPLRALGPLRRRTSHAA